MLITIQFCNMNIPAPPQEKLLQREKTMQPSQQWLFFPEIEYFTRTRFTKLNFSCLMWNTLKVHMFTSICHC